ncbi:hypothetical protein [Mycoplasma sp. 1654_15]|uniref:hypothetical protein n=1 Tax=Mycoplasma sp. 1654_15 TaxID=2725994 RepID=UPI0020C57F29|nr:hypothetical protein [Mycoplasma sp. 1654_15]
MINFNSPFTQENLPTVKELWETKSNNYKKWVYYCLASIVFLFVLNIILVSLISAAQLNNRFVFYSQPNKETGKSEPSTDLMLFPIFSLFFIFIALVYFVVSIIQSFKTKSFVRLGANTSLWIIISDILLLISFLRIVIILPQGNQNLFVENTTEMSVYFVFLIITSICTLISYRFLFYKVNAIRREFILSFNNELFQQQIKQMQDNPNAFNNIFDAFNKANNQNNNFNNPFVNPQQNTNDKNNNSRPNSETDKEQEARKKVENLSIEDLYKLADKLEISSYKTMPTKELIETVIKILASN